jgi:glycosyltransferase involved in cell wall biosynthesis
MKISIVVPAFNEEKLIAQSLENIQSARTAFHRLGWQSELIVCDNNSTDRTAEIARAAGAQVVFEPVNQISRSRNRGASAATGSWLVFVDADSSPCKGLFSDVAEAIQSGTCLGGGSTVRLDEFTGLLRWFVHGWNWLSRWNTWMAGSFIFCETRAFRELGGFSEQLFAAEELDFSKRLKDRSHSTGTKVVILHRYPLLTSGRKAKLYSTSDHVRMFFRTVLHWGKNLNAADGCPMWYDGRR